VLVVAATAASLIGVLAAGWTPILGVQLQGGVEVVLRPTEQASDESLDQAIEVIRNRIDALGTTEPDITRQGQQVVIQLPGVKSQQRAVELIGQTAELQFRPVLQFGPFDANDPQGRIAAQTLLELINQAVGVGSDDTEVNGEESTNDVVDEDEAPTSAVAPTSTVPDPADAPELDEVLTPADQADASDTVLFANQDRTVIFALGPAEVTGDAVAGAAATFSGSEWVVNVDFNSIGADEFDALAAQYFGEQIAIALDGVVYSAPTINAVEFGGTAVISGTLQESGAKDLATAVRFGALPIEFEQDDVRTVSATLGEGTLEAGVVAGIVGLILVGIYMLAYYRLLGLAAILSLFVSGSILWSIIAWLGDSRGLALTLAGATGIIVSIGVQLDSNIVYYERVKEEVRRGRAIRSAADVSFPNAFKTIIWADLASLIGAGVLYSLTSGSVKGFAVFLGITTIIDIFVSYFFLRPLVVLITRKMVREKSGRIGVVPHSDPAMEVSS